MLKIKNKLKDFKNLVRVVCNINTEVSFTFTPEYIYIRVVHPSNICMIIATIKKDMFEEYNVEKEITYTLDSKYLMMSLDKIAKEELSIKVEIDGLRLLSEKHDFLLNYFVGKKDERPLPQSELTTKWEIPSGYFLNLIGEMVEFSAVGMFKADEDLKLRVEAHLVKGDTLLDAKKISGVKSVSNYDMGYMIYISAIRHLFDTINFEFGNNTACYLTGKNEFIDFKWLLACRVREEDES